MSLRSKIGKSRNVWKEKGLRGLIGLFAFKSFVLKQKFAYKRWIRDFDKLSDADREEIGCEIDDLSNRPMISIILPVYDVEEKWLRLCIESVLRQLYGNWELCIADDCSPSPHIRPILEEYVRSDSRIKVVFRNENGHISAASNSALELATGEFTVLLDHDDELNEHALYYVAKEINEHPDVRMIYSDEDLIDKRGRRYGPKFKPDWSRDFFYSANLITHLSAYKTSLLKKIGGFTVGLDGSQDYDLALRVIEQIPESQICHIPRILYHWRVIETSVAATGDAKPYAHEAARNAIRAHLKRIGKKAVVTPAVHNLHRVHYELPAETPRVSLIFLSDKDVQHTVRSLKILSDNTSYPDVEFIVACPEGCVTKLSKVIGAVADSDSEHQFATPRIFESKLQKRSELLNLAASKASGDVICFADIELEPADPAWLEELVSFAVQKEIGASGARILDQNHTILHGGLLIGVGGTVGTAHRGWPSDADGNITRTRLIGNFSAVSVSCMAIRRSLFKEIGGFDEQKYQNSLFDADLCLRLGRRGLRIVWTPYAVLYQSDKHHQINIRSEIDDNSAKAFSEAWKSVIERDPFYNPNLSRENGDFRIDQS